MKFTTIAISKLEKKVYERYASVTEQPFSMENKEERRLLYPKFGEKTNPGVFMYLNDHAELCFSSQTKGKSLPELMLRDTETKRKIYDKKGKSIGGRWYPNPYPVFGDDLNSKKREPKDIDQHQVDIFLTFAGYENGYEDLSKFMEEFPGINTPEPQTTQSIYLFRMFFKNNSP
jgi:hypothetical protein